MPHHRRAKDDRHSYAALSRFIDCDGVLAALKVVEETPDRFSATAGTQTSLLVDIDALWG